LEVQGATENNIAAGLSVDQENNPIITGQLYGSNANVNPLGTSAFNLSSIGSNDCFVIKYNNGGTLWENTPLSIVDSQNKDSSLRIYANSTFDFILTNTQSPIKEVSIYNMVGQKQKSEIDNNKINVSNLANGVYIIRISNQAGEILTNKIYKILTLHN
jgi:hypothetical protein